VRVNGVAVGRVTKIDLSKDGKYAEVSLLVNGNVHLPSNAVATIQQTTLLGEKYVDIHDGAQNAVAYAPHGPVSADDKAVPVELDQFRHGYPAFLVTKNVKSFQGYGMGSYIVFIQTIATLFADEAFQAPKTPGVQFHDLLVVYLGGSMGVQAWLMKGFFDTIPKELDESARVDGATPAQIFWGVVLPLAAPVLVVVALISFVFTLNEFVIASALLQTNKHFTLPVGMQGFINQNYGQHWGPFAAGCVMAALPVTALFLFLQRWIVSGLTAGSVKG